VLVRLSEVRRASLVRDAIKGIYTGGDTVIEWVRQTPTIRNLVLRGQGHFYLGYKCQYRCRANSAEEFSQPSTLWHAVLCCPDEKLPKKVQFASAGVPVVSHDRKKLG